MTDLTKEQKAEKVQELKDMLDMMGVSYHHNAKLETLQALVEEAKGPKVEKDPEVDPRAHLLMKRYKITCMNPVKRDWKGEIFTAGNDVLGTVRKFIPYNCPAAEAWHIPAMLIDAIKDRKYLQSNLEKDSKGRDFIRKEWMPEFILAELPPLTEQEIARLAHMQRMQAAAGGMED